MKHSKNKYYRRSRISTKTFRRIIHAFAMDLTATDAAELTGLSVRATNTIYLKVRQRIAQDCEAQNPFRGEVEIDESYFGPKRIRGKRGRVDLQSTVHSDGWRGYDGYRFGYPRVVRCLIHPCYSSVAPLSVVLAPSKTAKSCFHRMISKVSCCCCALLK